MNERYAAPMFDHCLYFNTTALARQLERKWAEAFQPFGLTPPQAFLLRAVLDQPGLTLRDLAEHLVVSRPTATRSIDGLVAKGLLLRVGSQADGRDVLIQPTPEAHGLRAALNQASAQVTRQLKARLGESQFTDAVARVRHVRSGLG